MQLSSSIEKEHIWKHFSDKCGPIAHIEIRASRGVCVPTSKLPTPYWGLGTPLEGVHYATIHFTTPDGARKAIDLSGTELGGRNIIVSVDSSFIVIGWYHLPAVPPKLVCWLPRKAWCRETMGLELIATSMLGSPRSTRNHRPLSRLGSEHMHVHSFPCLSFWVLSHVF